MADIIKPLNEIARQSRKSANSLAVSTTVLPEFITIAIGDSPWSGLPDKLRSVTFVLWGIDGSNTVQIVTPDSNKTFNDDKYEGFSFSYAIDLSRDCHLSNNITLTIVGTATVDIIYTETSKTV